MEEHVVKPAVGNGCSSPGSTRQTDGQSVGSVRPADADPTPAICIQRPIYTKISFDETFQMVEKDKTPLRTKAKYFCAEKCICSGECLKRKLLALFPFILMLQNYSWRQWIVPDIIAGLSVAVIHIPQGMGFALLTGVPPVYGLYSSLFPVVIYFFFGTSRHISVGTMAVISLMIGAVVEREAAVLGFTSPDTTNQTTSNITESTITALSEMVTAKIGLALSISFFMGVIQVVMSIFNLGFLATYMSMPFVSGFLSGCAFHITTSQVPFLLGIKIPRHSGIFKLPKIYYDVFLNILEVNPAEVIIGVICITILVVLKEVINERFKKKLVIPIPAELIVVVLGILISHFVRLHHRFNVKVIGHIPRGIPVPMLPPMTNAQNYIIDAFMIAIIGFAISISMAKIFTRKHKYQIDTNQELLAYGLSNSVGAFFHSFGGAVAPPRSLVHDSTGGKSQVASLISSALVLLVCVAIGPWFKSLPNSVLGSIIIVAILPLFTQFRDLPMLFRINKYDFLVWIVTWASVVFLDISIGLGIGIIISLVTVVLQAQFTSPSILGSIENSDLYAPINSHRLAKELDGVKIFKFNAGLFYANSDKFKQDLFEATVNPQAIIKAKTDMLKTVVVKANADKGNVQIIENGNGANEHANQLELKVENLTENPPNVNGFGYSASIAPLRTIIIDCSAIQYMDIMGVNTIKQLRADYAEAGIQLVLANCCTSSYNRLRAIGLAGDGGQNITIYPTIMDAVSACGT